MPSKKRRVRQADIVRAFAQRLKGSRLARGMSQRDLAAQAHVTFSYISRLEAGGAAPGIDLLERLAQALKVNVADLLPGSPESGSVEAQRDSAKGLFEAVLSKVGPETLLMLNTFLARLAESPAVTR